MLIPYQQLSAEALNGLIEDFVTRDGTDNGDDTDFDTRKNRARNALEKHQAVIVYDSDSQQCQLVLRHSVPRQWLDDLAALE